jgi:hypothetical protein
VVPFVLALLFILAVALAVVAAFALPHLRAGSPLLTPKGERVARGAQGRLRRIGDALPAGMTGRLTSALTMVRVRIAGRSASTRTASAGSVESPEGVVADDPEPVAGAAPVRIEHRRIASPRPAEAASAPIARR